MAFGLLGEKLGHSYSVKVHHALGNQTYELFEKKESELGEFLKTDTLKGFNVTIPYKEKVIAYLDGISEEAKAIGAVNTVVKQEGKWLGYNTDYYGFLYLLKRKKVAISSFHFLVLGDGATSKTVCAALKAKGAGRISVLSRKKAPFYQDIADFYQDTDYIINTTSVGMYPHTDCSLISLSGFKRLKGVFDVIYNPLRTKLLLEAEERGLVYSDGLPMLIAQAFYADEIFFKRKNAVEKLEAIISEIRRDKENIILIGMPGVGKTTLGKALAKVLKRPFYDRDVLLRVKIGDLSAYIKEEGETKFRQEETAILESLGKETGMVIATGGGVITRQENYNHLRQNGRIYQLDKALSHLATKNRPFSQGGFQSIRRLYDMRSRHYQAFRQVYVRHRTKEKTVRAILEDFYENSSY